MYAKLNGTNLVTYPYGWSEFIADNPYTAYSANTDFVKLFPDTDVGKQGFSLVEVVQVAQPEISHEQNLTEETPVLVNGVWTQVWNVSQKNSDELNEINNAMSANVRKQRNKKLTDCDWTQVADAPVDKAAWATYRQALRDLPKEAGFPWDMAWPTEPTNPA